MRIVPAIDDQRKIKQQCIGEARALRRAARPTATR
jgi:hypothetical protein